MFEGTPADLVAAKKTLTGEHLAAFVGSRAKAAARADRDEDGERRGGRRGRRSA